MTIQAAIHSLIALVVGLSLIPVQQVDSNAVAQSADQVEIVSALLRDLAEPIREKYTPPRTIVLARTTLATCPKGKVVPCIVPVAFQTARREAAMGSWPFDLATEFEKVNESAVALTTRFEEFQYREFLFGASDERMRAYPTPLPLAISRPIVVNNQSLLAVQFARTWTWLVLLAKEPQGWTVRKSIVIGVS